MTKISVLSFTSLFFAYYIDSLYRISSTSYLAVRNFFFRHIFQFEGGMGEALIQVGAEFTKNQKMSIEELKERRRRDHKLDQFLKEQERRPECRRLGLQALLPVEHQRLVKYPLLLEQLAKQCDKEEEEFAKVRRCVDRSREILESIDKQVAEAQNIQRLAEIQANLDTSGLEKMPDSPICAEYRVRNTFTNVKL